MENKKHEDCCIEKFMKHLTWVTSSPSLTQVGTKIDPRGHGFPPWGRRASGSPQLLPPRTPTVFDDIDTGRQSCLQVVLLSLAEAQATAVPTLKLASRAWQPLLWATIRLLADFSAQVLKSRREKSDIFNVLKKEGRKEGKKQTLPTKNTIPTKTIL